VTTTEADIQVAKDISKKPDSVLDMTANTSEV